MEVLEVVWTVVEFVVTIVVIALVCVLGAVAAISAAVAAIAAFPVAGLLSLIWDVAFVDALAWTWSLMSLVVLLGMLGIGSRR